MNRVFATTVCFLFLLTVIGLLYSSELFEWLHLSRPVPNLRKIGGRKSGQNALGHRRKGQKLHIHPNDGIRMPCTNYSSRYDQVQYFLLFIGYARSGSTLTGSLLDAHPNVIIANEYGLAEKFKTFSEKQKTRKYIFNKLSNCSAWQAVRSQRSQHFNGPYNYHVSNQWQGKYNCSIKIIGEKKAVMSGRKLAGEGDYLLKELASIVKVPIKFIHVHRNPYDNIATMVLQHNGAREQAGSPTFKPLYDPFELEDCVKKYLSWARSVEAIRSKHKKDVFDLDYSQLIRKPRRIMRKLCTFLRIHCSKDYLESCRKKTFRKESHTRTKVIWTEELKLYLSRTLKKLSPYRKFKFDS